MSRVTSSSSGGAVQIQDSAGNTITSVAGRLLVNAESAFDIQDLKVQFNEVSTIAVGLETDINTYTAPVGITAYLLSILGAGENRAQFNIYKDGILLDRQYTNVTQLQAPFDYKTGASTVPGMVLPSGTVITVSVVNAGNTTANYNARFLILEVTE